MTMFVTDGTGKVAKQKQEINVPDSLVDTDAVNHSKEVFVFNTYILCIILTVFETINFVQPMI